MKQNAKDTALPSAQRARAALPAAAAFLAKAAAAALAAGVLSGAAVGTSWRPMGLAFLIACPEPLTLPAMAGCLAAYWLGTVEASYAAYLAACGVVTALRWLLTGFRRGAKQEVFLPSLIAAGSSLALTRLTVALLMGRPLLQAALALLPELGLVAALAFAFRRTLAALSEQRAGTEPALLSKLCCCAALACCAAAASRCDLGFLSAGHILVCFGAPAAVWCMPAPLGAALAASLCAGALFAEPAFAFAALGVAAAAAAGPLFRSRGKGVFALACLLPAALFFFAAPSQLYGAVYLTELLCGTLLFLLLPLPALAPAVARFSENAYAQATAAVSEKLLAAADSMRDVSALLGKALPNETAPDRGFLFAGCVEQVCRGCRGMGDCWLKDYDRTYARFGQLSDKLAAAGSVSRAEVQQVFAGDCAGASQLADAMSDAYRRFLARQRERRSAVVCREMLKNQFGAVSDMLLSVRAEVDRMGLWDERRSRSICECAARLGLPVQTVCCLGAAGDRPRVSVALKEQPEPELLRRLTAGVSLITGVRMAEPACRKLPQGYALSFLPQPRFRLETAAAQHAANRSACGDVYAVLAGQNDGRTHLLLSDGMGTGRSAADDGALSCSLLGRLLANGFEIHAAAELVNAAFSLREDAESACALDVFSFDRVSGEGVLFKAGAAATYLVQRGRVKRYSGRTLPVGILDKVFCSRAAVELGAGDLVVMLSDGLEGESGRIERLLAGWRDGAAEDLCRALLDGAGADALRDDATVLVARVAAERA